jgi:8-amino-7-oxononanoate synthase
VTTRRALDDEARRAASDLARRGLSRAPVGTDGLVDLVTNDALGLRRDPRVVRAASEALARAGLGAGGSRLLGGDDGEHRALEADLAAWLSE